jgi:ATP-dependent RNA helicase RhlE
LHGDKSQDERLKALEAFKKGEVDLLVCTDVAARGLDIKDVPAVFNFDIPFNAEDYMCTASAAPAARAPPAWR